MQTFALGGQKVDGAAFFKLLTMLKSHITLTNKERIQHIDVKGKLINLIWTLIYRENELQ